MVNNGRCAEVQVQVQAQVRIRVLQQWRWRRDRGVVVAHARDGRVQTVRSGVGGLGGELQQGG